MRLLHVFTLPRGRSRAAAAVTVLALVASTGLSGHAVGQEQLADPPSLVPVPGSEVATSDWDAVVRAPNGLRGSALGASGADSASVPLPGDTTRLHVKFEESAGVRWSGVGIDDGVAGSDIDTALASVAGVEVVPLFGRARAELDLERAEAERISGERQPDLNAWFLVSAPTVEAGNELEVALRGARGVEMVQPEPKLATTAPVEEERQGYLDPASSGVDAEWAWSQSAGTGSLVKVAVIDSGFDTAHSDLDAASAPGVQIAHSTPWDPHHGLQVLGILAGDDDGQGIRGIATGAGLHTVNSGRTSGEVANAINLASAAVGAGDIVSISQGICAVAECADGIVLPLVYSSSARDALRLASARGVITVVSAGNGPGNLNNYSSRLGADAPDAIVVGAGNPPPVSGCGDEDGPARSRTAASNYGSRVDLQGWGNCVRTAAQGGGYKWWGFTSGATPVVAGSAALLSSMAEERLGINLGGGQIRALFEETGSPQVTSAGSRGGHVGPLPDIRAAIGSLSLIPANDMWESARVVDELPFAGVVETRWVGVEVGEPAVLCGDISHTVWYEITPQTDVEVTIDTRGSEIDTLVGLWQLQDEDLQRITCDDDISPNNPRSELSRTLVGGETYYVQVGAADGEAGTMRISVRGAGFGSVGCDIDNDGFGDVVSGSPHEDVGSVRNAGRALVHFGRSSGRPKVVTSVSQEWPGVTGASERADKFGWAVACGDFDADGYDDIAIGGPGEDVGSINAAGAVRVVVGGSDGLSRLGARTFTQASPGTAGKVEANDRFGAALAVGDFNGDGYDDLAVASPGEAIGKKAGSGGVHVLYGSFSGLSSSDSQFLHGSTAGLPNKAEAGDEFGDTLAAGDLNFDSYDELVIGSPGEGLGGKADAGAVFVLHGAKQGVATEGSAILHQGVAGVVGANEPGDRFGAALSVGNVNGDDYHDLVVGVPKEAIGDIDRAGMVYLFPGGPLGADPAGSVGFHQDTDEANGKVERNDRFGSALAVGDLNGDGYADIAVGVPGEDISGVNGAGLVQVVFGSEAGVGFVDDVVVSQSGPDIGGAPERNDHVGAAVAMVDINADGYADLVLGVPDEDAKKTKNAGYILLVPGSANGVDQPRASSLSQKKPRTGANERGDRFGYALAG